MMLDNVCVVEGVSHAVMDNLFKNKKAALNQLPDIHRKLYPNDIICLRNGSSSALAIVNKSVQVVTLVDSKLKVEGIKPRNQEQFAFLHCLMDPEITLNIGIGRAGSGKTLLALAAAVNQVIGPNAKYQRLVLTKPMDTVGKISLGALPGDLHDKFSPYATSYMHQFEEILG